ncbi:MAG: F0F1 ATP synthase subunit A [Anaerolineae bacterium]|jgi:F-type H+-transporting ATPase subunit a|nr:F0F1 ATP synthase subunit A [Anaerolineae bacterium]
METVTPKVVFNIFGMQITDTVTSTWIIMAIMIILSWWISRKAPVVLELIVDFINDSLSDVMGMNAMPYVPFIGTFTLFIAGANTFSLIPGVNNPTRDLNTPAALAITVFFSVYYFGIRSRGLWGYLKSLAEPVFVLLPFELIGHFTRALSLTLRLFGNVVSIELIVAIIFSLLPIFLPSVMALYGAATGLIQAYIFSILAASYIAAGVAVNEELVEKQKDKNQKKINS